MNAYAIPYETELGQERWAISFERRRAIRFAKDVKAPALYVKQFKSRSEVRGWDWPTWAATSTRVEI